MSRAIFSLILAVLAGVAVAGAVEPGDEQIAALREEGDTKFNVFYVGPRGRLLARETTMTSSYTLKGDEAYVRARIVSSRAEFAWTQPLFR